MDKQSICFQNCDRELVMKKQDVLIALIFLGCGLSYAQESSSKKVQISAAAAYTQRRIYRGALIWDAPIMAVGPGLVLYNTVSLGQGGLSIFKNFNKQHTVRLGFSYFDDNEPSGPVLKLRDSEEDFKNQRRSTFGTYLKYDFKYKQFISTSISYHQDLKRHYGNYFYGSVATSIIPFFSFGTGLGYGSADSNKYTYGPEGKDGFTHFEYFGRAFFPFLPGKGVLSIIGSVSHIILDENKHADYIRGNSRNNNLSIVASWRF